MLRNTHSSIALGLGACLAFASLLGASRAAAFPDLPYWHMPAAGAAGMNRAGAGGIYGTGGRTDFGVRCSHCHVGGEGRIGVDVTASPAFGSAAGEQTYRPGQRYRITVTMTGEHRRTTPDSANSMALAIEDASGRVAGRYLTDTGLDSASCSPTDPFAAGHPPGTTAIHGDCHAVLALATWNTTSWTFDWIAPAAGAGELTMFVAVVDGDTEGSSSLDDDTVERAIPLVEAP